MRRRSVLALPLLACAAARADGIAVHAERHDRRVVIEVQFSVPAPAAVVWDVLTDFEHMPRFLSAVTASSVKHLESDRLEVAQTFETQAGPFRFAVKSTRAVVLKPLREIHATLLDGDFDAYEATTRLEERGPQTHVHAHSESVPKSWAAGLVPTTTVETEARHQWEQVVAEISRRARP